MTDRQDATGDGADAPSGDPAAAGGDAGTDADERAGRDRPGAQTPATGSDEADDSDAGSVAGDADDPRGQAAAGETRSDAVPDETQTEAAADETDDSDTAERDAPSESQPGVPADVATYDRFKKMDGATYERANEFLRDRTYITAREWAIARLCADFRTETGVEMTKIGEHLPELVPFMTDTYTPQAVNQARAAFEEKVRKAGATFLYGAMCDFFTAEELDDVMYEATEVAKFLLEVEGVELSVEEELDAEDRISAVMREVRESSAQLRYDECPHCGEELDAVASHGHEADS